MTMGADQSTASNQLRSQRDEDIPYTSYSISKPIDSDSPRATAARVAAQRRSPQPPSREHHPHYHQHHDNSGAHAQGAQSDIILVAEGNADNDDPDLELDKLAATPMFLPLLRASLNIPNAPQLEQETLEKLSSKQVLQLCHRYQEHMRQCSEAVAFDQNALCVRVKEVDIAISTLYNNLTDRQKKFARYAEQIKKVNEMSSVLTRVKMSVDQVIPLMERLNSVLPAEDQLEPFSMSAKSK